MLFPDLSSIKIRRKRLGLGQKELASLSSVSQSLIAKLEKGKLEPSYSIARNIFDTLDRLEHKQEKKCKDIMTPKLIFVKKSDKIEKASDLMKKNSIDQIPVLESERLIGLLCRHGI